MPGVSGDANHAHTTDCLVLRTHPVQDLGARGKTARLTKNRRDFFETLPQGRRQPF